MIQRPILFSAPMIRALLDGTKTQTRRVVKARPDRNLGKRCMLLPHELAGEVNKGEYSNCPYGQPGSHLWVRETWIDVSSSLHSCVIYRADGDDQACGQNWRPSIFMPRWASRILLEVTAVRVERLQDISRGDAMAEGCPFPNMAQGDDPRQWYADLWRQINGPDSWDLNPFVWDIEFKVVQP